MFGKEKAEQADMEFFTVYDSKSKTYAEPFPATNREVLLRDFTNAFKKAAMDPETKSTYFLNSEDFSIFSCAKFSKVTGTLAGNNLEHVINLHDLRAMVVKTQSVTAQ